MDINIAVNRLQHFSNLLAPYKEVETGLRQQLEEAEENTRNAAQNIAQEVFRMDWDKLKDLLEELVP